VRGQIQNTRSGSAHHRRLPPPPSSTIAVSPLSPATSDSPFRPSWPTSHHHLPPPLPTTAVAKRPPALRCSHQGILVATATPFHLLIWGRFGKGSDSNRLIQWARKGLIFHVEPGGRSILLRLCCYFNKGIS
uniref:Uncharacterized protein n=1 Tax=Oryza meridionalis TaxID=40149 RepID=A0A0E0F421_9ORYZ